MMNDNSLYMSMGVDTGAPLLEIDTFCIRAWPGHAQWESIITHDCNGNETNWITPLNAKPRPCPDCHMKVPPEIVAAWILHNYDRIQRRR